MSLKNNILSRTVTFLKENHLDIKDLNEEMVRNVMSSDNLSEQVDSDDNWRKNDTRRGKPFNKKELAAVKLLHKNFTEDELHHLSSETPTNMDEKFWGVMKLLGYDYKYGGGDAQPKNTRVAHYAKLALDNYTEEGNYEDIYQPIRTPLSWWNVELEQTGSQIEMKHGDVTVMGYDEHDAETRATEEFIDWEGEWETLDYGDYEPYDTEMSSITKIEDDPFAITETIRQALREQGDGEEDGAERLYKQHAHDNEDYVDDSPFTPMEVKILKQLHKHLTKPELEQLTNETPETYKGGTGGKFWNVMKLFGIEFSNDMEEDTRQTKYVKWALDNWTEEGDYENIEAPIKVPLKWYEIDRRETGSQIEYKDGTTEVLGFGEDDASERADYDFYGWGGEMETSDWGDYDTHDSHIEDARFMRLDESIKRILREQEEGPDLRTKALISIGGIQRDKVTTPKFIKNIFKSSGHEAKSAGIPEGQTDYDTFYKPGDNINLGEDLERVRDRIRFEEYGEMFQQGIEGRGFAFEGMLAGLFNGEPMEAGGKEDIKVGNDYYSIKQSNPGDAWDTGSLMKGFDFAKENMRRDGFSEEDIPPTPIDLMVAGKDYIPYQAQMLTESFKASNGQPLRWIFAHVLNDKQIEYEVLDSEELIGAILSSDCTQGTRSQQCAVGRSRKGDTGVRIKSRFVLGNPKMITFPTVSEEEIRSIIYDPEGDRVEDKIRRLFKEPNKVSQYTVEYIKNNPKEFQDAVNAILPNLTMEERRIAYNLLLEETDVFGQGLFDPIAPEEFEGDEEEWEKIVKDTEEEGDKFDYDEDEYVYTGGETDPGRGFVAPSKEVTTNVCRVEGFCQEQGPITFGQLKELVEAATSKRIQADIGRGVFKSLWRIVPFFVPQILLAAVGVTVTRAFNKIITPALTDTRGYKEWWGKAVLKAMDIAEGDYIPDITMGDDPLSKVFFISDGLMSMIKDKYKLKFARYVADYAAARPASEPVPDWFVENLLRDYLNQKFLLNPPLPVKMDIETNKLDESYPPLKPEEQKKIALTTQVFNTLDDEFSLHPHPEGDIESVEEPVALYSQSLDMFVPMDYIFTPINNMIDGGIPKEDIEMFVDIITDWLNQRINLKTSNHLNEDSHNPFGLLKNDWKDELLSHEKNLSKNELKYKKIADKFDGMTVTIPVDIRDGAEPVIGTTDITFTIVRPFIFQGLRGDFFDNMRPSEDYKDNPKRPTVIKYDLVFRGVEPGSILEELLDENSLEGMHIHNISARERLIELLTEESYNINEVLMKNYFKLYGVTIGRLGKIYDTQDLKEQHQRDSWQEEKRLSKDTHDDTKLNVAPEIIWKYLDTTHRERLIKEITPTLHCLEYNCYEGWKNDPDNEWDEDDVDFDDQAQGHCNECGDELNAELERVDRDLVKLGFAQEHDSEGYDDQHRKTWLEKPFPYSYSLWIDGLVKEINPRFYVDVNDDISYEEAEGGIRRGGLNETIMDEVPLEQFKEENPEVREILDRFPETLQRELAVERKNPKEFVEDFGNYYLNSKEPIEIYLEDELNKEHTINTLSRTPLEVVDVINDTWDTDFESVEVFDPNPSRYFKYAELSPNTAPPSLMVNGEILYGVARFVSALLRGDETFKVWDIIEKENLNEHNQPGLSPDLDVDDVIRVIDIDGEHSRMPERWGVYKVKEVKQDNATQEFYYDIVPYVEDFDDFIDITFNTKTLYRGDTWIPADMPMAHNVDRKTLSEHKESKKLNPELMVGDEILVVSTEGIHDFGAPELYKPYVVVGIKHGTTMMKGGKELEDYPYYQVEPIGMTDEERTGAMLAGGGRMKPMYIFPRQDQWIHGNIPMANKVDRKTISEHQKPKLNPDLEEGDKILVVNRRPAPPGVREPLPGHTPDLFTTYVVIEKKYTGHKAKHPYHYFLLPEDKYDVFINDPYAREVDDLEKSLFPWVHDWILDKEEDIISEQKEPTLNPELKIGDEIIVVDVGGTKEYMNQYAEQTKPDKYIRYFVTKIYGNKELDIPLEDVPNHLFDTPEGPHYYGLNRPNVDVTDPDNPGVFDRSSTHKYLHPGIDTWMFNPKGPTMKYEDAFDSDFYLSDEEYEELYGDDGQDEYGGYLNEHKESRLNPELMVGDEVTVIEVDKSFGTLNAPDIFTDYVVTGIYQPNKQYQPRVSNPYPYYHIEPIGGYSDEEATGRMLSGGGKIRDLHLYDTDKWILRKGFLRGEHLTEDDSLNDLVYRDEPRPKHTKRMEKDLGDLRGFPLDKYRNMPPPENESSKTEEEIGYLEGIAVDKTLVDSADEIREHFTEFLSSKGLEYPIEELKQVMPGVKAIILRLKYYYNRPRPWQIAQAKGLPLNSETLQSSSSPSYPSGHATQGRFVARYLADLYPQYEKEIRQIGEDIAYSRNMAKVHYPSDSNFGKLLGDDMYEYVYKPQKEELETELDEYCPMGNPNRCEIVDYDRLPDTIHEGVIIDDSSHPYTEDQYIDFIEYAIDQLEIQEPPQIKIESEATSKYTTGSYNRNTGEIKVKGNGRQLADLLRSIAHEMVHHRQNELGLIVGKIPAVGGKIEDDANLYAGRLVKSYGQQIPEIYTESTIQKVFRRKMNEALEPDWSIRRGRQHYAMNQPSHSGEPVAAFNDYLVKNSPFNYMGFDYYLSAVPGDMPGTAIIDIFVPMLDTGKNAETLWDGTEIVYYTQEEDEVYDPNYYDDPEENYRIEEIYKRIEQPRHLISYHERYGEHYAYDSFLDELDYDERHWENNPRDYVNEPGVAYATSWVPRRKDLIKDIEELQKLFGIENTILNRDPNRPWSRTPDSYGNEKIRPGKTVPRRKELETV